MSRNKAALICDLAETYHIYDWQGVPIKTLGILVAGLRPNSRVAMAQAGEDYSIETMLLASIADATRLIVHGLFAKKGSKQPPSLVEAMREKPKVKEELNFKSGAEFDAARERILMRYNDG